MYLMFVNLQVQATPADNKTYQYLKNNTVTCTLCKGQIKQEMAQ